MFSLFPDNSIMLREFMVDETERNVRKPFQRPVRICIVTTSIIQDKGSMAKYAELLQHALFLVGRKDFAVQVLNLGPQRALLDKIPRYFRTVFYHGHLIFKAVRLRKLKTDIFHLVDGSYAHVINWFPAKNPAIVTAHDIIPLLQLKSVFRVPPPGIIARFIIRQSIKGLRKADTVIAVSENTKKDIVNYGNLNTDRIRVILSSVPHSIALPKNQMPLPAWKERRETSDAYILHVGNDGFYKNRKGVVRIFQKVRKKVDVRLIMVGPKPSTELLGIIDDFELAGNIDFIENPNDNELAKLYADACLFLFPSIYEGFGWPPLEAMVLQCPVVCSDRASLPEVVGEAALMADPEDETLMAELCLSILNDKILANELIKIGLKQAEKFSADDMGRQIRAVYLKVFADTDSSK